eukprot:7231566-Prymnesium_polylepis.1
MRAHNRGLCVTRRSKRHSSGLQTAFEEKTDFFFLTDRSALAGPFYDRARGAPGPWCDGGGVTRNS